MRLDPDEIQKIHGKYVSPSDVRVDDVFLDPWGIAWRATGDLSKIPPAPGHTAIGAIQLTMTKENTVVDQGSGVICEVPIDKQCKVLNTMTWKVELEDLFYFDPEE